MDGRRSNARRVELLLILALWWPATMFPGPSRGWWNDDYYMCGRDPATGAIVHYIQTAPSPFDPRSPHVMAWRPVAYVSASFLITFFWSHDGVVHAFQAVLHLASVLLLWRLLAAFDLGWRARLLGALVLLCHPAPFEGILWSTVMCVPMAAAVLLLAAGLYLRHVSGELSRAGHVVMVLLLAGVPLIYEQTAACAAALPLLALARARRGEPAERWARRDTWRVLWPLLLAGAFLGVYLQIITSTLPSTTHGSAGSLSPPGALAPRWLSMTHELGRQMLGSFVRADAMRSGLESAREHLLPAGGVLAAGLLGFVARAREWARASPDDRARPGEHQRLLWLAIFALAWIGLSVLPVAAVSWAQMRPRMTYPGLIGLAVLVAAIADALRSPLARPGRVFTIVRTTLGVLVLVACASGVLSLMGAQRGYRLRSHADARSLEEIRAALPDLAPGSVLVPLGVDNAMTSLGRAEINWYYASPWYWSWSWPSFARLGLHRGDVRALFHDDSRRVLVNADAEGFTFDGPLPPEITGQSKFLWRDAIPLTVARDGGITLRSPVRIEIPAGMIEVAIPQVEAARRRGARVETFVIRP